MIENSNSDDQLDVDANTQACCWPASESEPRGRITAPPDAQDEYVAMTDSTSSRRFFSDPR